MIADLHIFKDSSLLSFHIWEVRAGLLRLIAAAVAHTHTTVLLRPSSRKRTFLSRRVIT